jgi:hypothetical protein
MKKQLTFLVILFTLLFIAGCSGSGGGGSKAAKNDIIVNSLEDVEDPPDGTVTLRSALALAANGQTIVFDTGLDGGTIELSLVGEEHTILKGEVMGMRVEPSGPVSYLVGYFDRDYGKSALYTRKDVVIDASALPSGITLSWVGGAGSQARVLAVYGDLTMTNVSVTGGRSIAEDISTGDPDDQPWTLARGGGVAVWGVAWLVDCKLYNNHCEGDFGSSRDRGAFGGGLYANIVDMANCVVSGNTILGAGAAGGGVFSVGGADSNETTSTLERSSITGNRISGLFTYGGGVYSDGGGIGNRKTLELINCTIAWNIVDPPDPLPPEMPSFLLAMGYWRGGAVYMSNGYLYMQSCTVVENEVHGVSRTDDLGKPNLAGGIAATIGNAHAVENMNIGHSVIAGNTVHDLGDSSYYDHDVFTGSLLYFKSMGYNRIGVMNFSQILVPVGERDWASLCRRHYPKEGDEFGVNVGDVLDLASGATYSDSILSAGVNSSDPVVLYYEPWGSALDQLPPSSYSVEETFAEYRIASGGTNDFLAILLDRVEAYYGLTDFVIGFTGNFETFLQTVDADDATAGIQPYTDPSGDPILTLADTQWFGPAVTWPKNLSNYPYIEFWHRFDVALDAESIPGMGPELLGDDAWAALFSSGALFENGNITMTVWTESGSAVLMQEVDQLGNERPANTLGDIGAIEIP